MTGHVPVMTAEALEFLQPARGGVFLDCTVGLGGHSRAMLEAGASRVIGIDRDLDALAQARTTLAPWPGKADLVHSDYREIDSVLDGLNIALVDGALADLGVSSMQFDEPGRGFSFQRDEPLDMRMDRTSGETAAQLVARVDEGELADVIYQYGEERHSRRIARALVRARDEHPVSTTGELAAIVRRSVPHRGYQRIDPATRTFQALRIWVNGELEGLDRFVRDAVLRLRAGARLVVIAFHSLEDRIVKHTLRGLDREAGTVRVLTARPEVAGEDEIARNPRARSAKLRAAERLAAAGVDESAASHRDGRGARRSRREEGGDWASPTDEQRRAPGCIGRRMQRDFHHRLLGA
jgi:16S rRNA (cytosine1402-N4)-methyltransferase